MRDISLFLCYNGVMKVCFIGHRKIENKEEIKQRLFDVVSILITQGADTFLFGSRSDFDYICWSVVTELREKFFNVKRIKYNAPHEMAFTSKAERENFEMLFLKFAHKEAHYTDYEEVIDCEKSFSAGKNAYIMRNQEMIDNSDVCVFYFDENYLPPRRQQAKRHVVDYQPQSGTAIAFAYATQKKKKIVNIFGN